jgi:hypothetical protein
MLLRKYLALYSSTYPWIWCCLATWLLDRFFVEFGHRTSDAPMCTHSDLQYVQIHQYITMVAVASQIIYSVKERITQFKRECALMDIRQTTCKWHIHITQTIICLSWSTIIVCIVDVSPWLCIPIVVQYRASIAILAIIILCISLPLEAWLWDKTINQYLPYQTDSIDI